MRLRIAMVLIVFAASGACFAKTNPAAWLKKVPAKDRQRLDPYAGQAQAIASGGLLFLDHCAKCHGRNAEGKGSRPSLRALQTQQITDGDLAWILKNGQIFRGMPSWAGLPEAERWQIIAYLRSLNSGGAEATR